MDASGFREAVIRVHDEGRRRGHYFQTPDDKQISDRVLHINGQRLLSFGSCSYLGLEFDPRLIAGAAEAYRRFGSQNSYSRGYLSCPLYDELEGDIFPQIFDVPNTLLLPSTSVAHHVVMPALLAEEDVAVCDHQVHRSVDDAVTLQCARSNAKKVLIRHGELDQALDKVEQLARRHRTVWFFCDGVYSMYGDTLPISFLRELLGVAPNVRLYVDDAHGMSWAGVHGRGHFLARFPLDERVVLVTSLAKAYATGGGVLVARDAHLIETARMVGGPYSFSGPLRPGDLGASIASGRLHLSDELGPRQAALHARVAQANSLCRTLGVPTVVENETPIFFIALGRAEAVFLMAERLRNDGFYVNVSGFPAVPASRGGLRVALNSIHTEAEVQALFEAIAQHLPGVLATVGVTREEVEAQFHQALPAFLRGAPAGLTGSAHLPEGRIAGYQCEFKVEIFNSIDEVDSAEWDAMLGGLAYIDSGSMSVAERVFNDQNPRPEHRWTFRYVVIRDAEGVAAAAPLTTSIVKDDTFMSSEVSRALERERERDPYLFAAPAVTTGTLASEGVHVYLRPGPGRAEALVRLVETGVAEMKAQGCSTFIIRDLPEDPEIMHVLNGQGLVPFRLLDTHVVDLEWSGEEDFIASLPTKGRRKHVRTVNERTKFIECEIWDASTNPSDEELLHLHALYANLSKKNLRINIFSLPPELLRAQLESGSWEFLVLRLRDKSRRLPIAWGATRHIDDVYRLLYCGVDYEGFDVEELSPYRQFLWEVIRRAGSLGCRRIYLGMGTDLEKERFGSTPHATYAFVRSDDEYRAAELQEFITRLATEKPEQKEVRAEEVACETAIF